MMYDVLYRFSLTLISVPPQIILTYSIQLLYASAKTRFLLNDSYNLHTLSHMIIESSLKTLYQQQKHFKISNHLL